MLVIAGEWGGVPTDRFLPTKYFWLFSVVDPGALEIELIEQFDPNLFLSTVSISVISGPLLSSEPDDDPWVSVPLPPWMHYYWTQSNKIPMAGGKLASERPLTDSSMARTDSPAPSPTPENLNFWLLSS